MREAPQKTSLSCSLPVWCNCRVCGLAILLDSFWNFCFQCMWKAKDRGEIKRSSSCWFMPKCLYQPGLGWNKARSAELHLGLPSGWQGHKDCIVQNVRTHSWKAIPWSLHPSPSLSYSLAICIFKNFIISKTRMIMLSCMKTKWDHVYNLQY